MGFILLLALIPAAICTGVVYPADCTDVYNRGFQHSGVYTIYPEDTQSPVHVYCDMVCDEAEEKWIVIQRRQDGSVGFVREWCEYRTGFGEISGEYWLGLEKIHVLTQKTNKNYELKIDMEDFDGYKACVYYSNFSVGSENEGYALNVTSFRDGSCGATAGNSLSCHNGMKFSTVDKDQDTHSANCARKYHGGWWYKACHKTNPNGVYAWGDSEFGQGINWKTWRGYTYSLKSFTMKIRPKQEC